MTRDQLLERLQRPREHQLLLPFILLGDKKRWYRNMLWERDPHCSYCRLRIKRKKATLDHVVPKSQGGTDTPSNLVLCCKRCNESKDNKDLGEWIGNLLSVFLERIEVTA